MEVSTNTEQVFSRLREWGCDVSGGLERFLEDEDLYIRCLKRFSHDPALINLQEYVKDENWKGAYEIAHSFKGSSGTLNLTPLYTASNELTSMLDGDYAPDKDKIDEQVKKLTGLYSDYCHAVGR